MGAIANKNDFLSLISAERSKVDRLEKFVCEQKDPILTNHFKEIFEQFIPAYNQMVSHGYADAVKLEKGENPNASNDFDPDAAVKSVKNKCSDFTKTLSNCNLF